jgi:hypothetical protein
MKPNVTRHVLVPFTLTLVLGGAQACSSAPKADHIGTDGSYGFDGAGWAPATTTGKPDRWVNGAKSLFVSGPAVAVPSATTADAWATKDAASTSTATQLFATKSFNGSTSAFWYGWVFNGSNVYEYYSIDPSSKKALQAELSGPALSESDASSLLATLRLL